MKILLSVTLATFLLVGCSNEEQAKSTQTNVDAAKVVTTQETTGAKIDAVIQTASQSADEVTKSVKELSETTVEKTKELVDQAKTVTTDAVEKTKEVAKDVADGVQTSAAAVSESLSTKNELGASTYKACASCHGINAEKPALGKSKVIQGWSVSKILHALDGYKDGSYGGSMKGLMKGQASGLTEEKAKAVAEYISTL